MSANENRQDEVGGGLSIEDAETFAAQIKPAWEMDWEDRPEASEPPTARLESKAPPAPVAEPPPPPAPQEAAARARPPEEDPLAKTTPSAQAPAIPAALAAGERPASDTIIEGVPTVDVGTPEPVAAPPPPVVVQEPPPPAPGPPLKPGKTKLGIGTDPGDAPKSNERKPVSTRTPAAASGRTSPAATGPTPAPPRGERGDTPVPSSKRSRSSKAPLPLNGGAGRARTTGEGRVSAAIPADDRQERSESVEIPVAQSPLGTILKLAGAAAVLVGIVVVFKMVTSDDEPSPPRPQPTATPTATAAATPAATPAETTAPTPPPPPVTSPPTATPAPEPTPPPVSTPTRPAAPPVTASPGGKKPPGTPPPGKPGEKPTGKKPGGLIRETPF